jgi:Trk-type K+ transport system membrane component
LKTPRATPAGIGWADALFTATSAVCVTGLTTLETATAFTRHGQWIILCLVQIGGLGVMSFTYFFAYFLAGGVSLRNRFALQDLLSEDNLGQIGAVLGTIIIFTFGCEAAGAAAIYSLLEMDTGDFFVFSELFAADSGGIPQNERLFFSIFHSVTAFCNAGFSTLDGNLANGAMAGRDGVLLVIMALVFAGGTGFPVVKNCWQTFLAAVLRKIGLRLALPPRLSTNTKLVLVTTVILGVGGALGIYATEFLVGGANVGGGHNPWLVAAFDATASRTAGFTLTTHSLFTPATTVIIMFLMFVGGSPSSTSGGIKTTTLAVAFLSLRRVLLGREDIEVFGRRLDDSIAHRALATIFVAVAFIAFITMLLCLLHPKLPAIDLGFEAISAVCTAGMSRDITPQLGDAAKVVLVVAMFFGRVGVLTCLLALVPRRDPPLYRLPEDNVVIN